MICSVFGHVDDGWTSRSRTQNYCSFTMAFTYHSGPWTVQSLLYTCGIISRTTRANYTFVRTTPGVGLWLSQSRSPWYLFIHIPRTRQYSDSSYVLCALAPSHEPCRLCYPPSRLAMLHVFRIYVALIGTL